QHDRELETAVLGCEIELLEQVQPDIRVLLLVVHRVHAHRVHQRSAVRMMRSRNSSGAASRQLATSPSAWWTGTLAAAGRRSAARCGLQIASTIAEPCGSL